MLIAPDPPNYWAQETKTLYKANSMRSIHKFLKWMMASWKCHFKKKTPIQDIEKLTDWVKQQKIKKLKRAETNRVYRWPRSSDFDTQQQRSASFNLTSSDKESPCTLSNYLIYIRFVLKRRKHGGAAIKADLFRFYRSLHLKVCYHQDHKKCHLGL